MKQVVLEFEQSRTDFCRLLGMRISMLTGTWFSDLVSSLSIFVFGYGFLEASPGSCRSFTEMVVAIQHT